MGATGTGFTFWDAIDGAHPNADVRVCQTVGKAGDVQRDWRNAQAEIERLRLENASLHRIVDKLTGVPDAEQAAS